MHGERTRRPVGVLVALSLLLALPMLAVAGPVKAQTNSPSGGQNTGQTPTQGGPGANGGANVGGDGQAGNRTTPGGAGATGGGSSGAGERGTADGGRAGMIAGVVGVAAVAAAGIAIATRHRRVMEDATA